MIHQDGHPAQLHQQNMLSSAGAYTYICSVIYVHVHREGDVSAECRGLISQEALSGNATRPGRIETLSALAKVRRAAS